MVDLTDFIARNRTAGGINARLADALEANLAPRQTLAPTPPVAPGMFGIAPGLFGAGREAGERGDLGAGVRGGSFSTLASILAGPASFPLSTIAGLVANDALGNAPSTSLFGAGRSFFNGERRERGDRGRVSRPDRVRSSSNREAGGGFVE